MSKTEIRKKFRFFIQQNNGHKSWDKYKDSILEEDIINFILSIIKELK
jgi:hypothetical protein